MDEISTRKLCLRWTKFSFPTIALLGTICIGAPGSEAQVKSTRQTVEPVHRKVTPLKTIRNKVKELIKAKQDKKKVPGPIQSVASQPKTNKAPKSGVLNIAPDLEIKKAGTTIPGRPKAHALDPAIQYAHDRLAYLNENIHDYSGVVIKQERINGKLLPAEYMKFKVINRRNGVKAKQPLSIYMKFFRPSNVKGREVIWVEGKNQGKLIAHEAEPFNIMSVQLKPTGMLAMRNNRYPVTDFGIQNLIEKLIERASRDRQHGDCKVEFFENATVRKRPCSMIQVTHDEQKAPFDFHVARIYIDDEYKIPVRYEAYTWPEEGSTELPLLESYTYAALKFNTGLKEKDFDPENEKYNFPK